MASIPEHEYEYNRTYSIYGNLTKMIEFYHGGRGFLTNEDTVRKLLWLIKERTGINYVPESAVVDAHAKSYSEGYETGRVETRRAYEGKRYTEAEMDKHGQYKYQEGYAEGRKVEHDHAFSLGENAGYERRKKHVQVSEEHFYAKGHNEGYQKGKAEGVAIGIKVKDEAINEYRKDGYNEGLKEGYLKGCQEAEEKCAAQRQLRYQQGFEEGTKCKEKFTNDRAEASYKKGHSQGIKDAWQKFDQGTTWEDGYQQGKRDADAKHQVLTAKAERRAHDAGFADGYAKGKQQGKKEVVDFINNMKVSQ